MSMTDKEAASVLRTITITLCNPRGNGKSHMAALFPEAISKAIDALERSPRPVIVKGRIIERKYCPTCHERVKKRARFCHACGQAIRKREFYDDLRTIHAPPPPMQSYGTSAGIVILDEFNDQKK